jgi:hypothetical protein
MQFSIILHDFIKYSINFDMFTHKRSGVAQRFFTHLNFVNTYNSKIARRNWIYTYENISNIFLLQYMKLKKLTS